MAGAGGTAPKKQDDIEALREALIPELMKHLGGQAPTPPQYQPAPISPMQGYAMARNPQAAGLINQTIQAPAQAQFAQQQAAFEAAMGQRQQATGLAAGLINAQTRQSGYGGRPALATIIDEDGSLTGTKGKRITANVSRGPDGRISSIEEVGPTPWAPQIVQGTEGGQEKTMMVEKPGTGGTTRDLGIKPLTKPGVVEDISDTTQLLRNIDSIRANPLVAQGGTGERAKRIGQEVVRAMPLVGPQVSAGMNPDLEKFEADIDNVRSRVQLLLTGKAVNTTEIKRLIGLIPAGSTAVDPAFFNASMDRFYNEFKASMQRQARLRSDLFTPEELLSLGMTGSAQESGPSSDAQRYMQKHGITVKP